MSTNTPTLTIEDLSREHSGALLAWARHRFADTRDAEEVVAETMVRAWKRYHQFDPSRGSQRAWLFGIAKNVASDHYRRSERHLRAVVNDDTVDDGRLDLEIDRLVESSHVRDALNSLSFEHRSALVDAYYNNKSTAEIARQQQIPAGTVKSRLYYALKAMRVHLEERNVVQ